jgi:hypothetical protein
MDAFPVRERSDFLHAPLVGFHGLPQDVCGVDLGALSCFGLPFFDLCSLRLRQRAVFFAEQTP